MKHRVSFCTVCMNRLSFLKRTLPKNIADNKSYKNIEFVVLNYNSKDGLDTWMTSEMARHIESGVLVYLKTTDPEYFLMSHSKNVAHKNASGDILCNVDADNFIGKGFSSYLNSFFRDHEGSYLSSEKGKAVKGVGGRIALKREHFTRVGGYDESMKGYGFEDVDIQYRLALLNIKPHPIKPVFINAVDHDDNSRIENEPNFFKIKEVYFKHIDHASTELLYIFDNNTFKTGIVLDNALVDSKSIDNLFRMEKNVKSISPVEVPYRYRNYFYSNSLQGDKWNFGNFKKSEKHIELEYITGTKTKLERTQMDTLKHNVSIYHKIKNDKLFLEMIMFYSQINNRIKMFENLYQKEIDPNEGVYGRARLSRYCITKNFRGWKAV